MDNNSNPSLLGFLQKKSLFSNSPSNRNRNRSRSNSRDQKFVGSRSNVYQLEQPNINNNNNNKFTYQEDTSRNYPSNERLTLEENTNTIFKQNSPPNDSRPYSSIQPQNQFRSQQRNYQTNIPRSDIRAQPRNFNVPIPTSPTNEFRGNSNQDERYFRTSEVRSNRQYEGGRSTASRQTDFNPYQNQLWSGLVAHSHSFESARVESIQCLESLGGRIAGQISNINYKIETFNSAMSKALSGEFRNMRDRILQMVDAVFRESDRFIRDYMRQQESKMAGDIIKMRDTLLKEQAKIEVMKGELKKQDWRKTAGEILTTELQKRVEELIRSSGQMDVGHWQMGDVGGTHLQRIQSEMRQLIQVKPI